jgi:hypothetical protein
LGLQLIEEYEADAMHRAQPRSLTQAHAAHPRFEKTIAATRQDASVACAPSALLGADSPEVVARLESLDDVVFDAVQGKGEAMSQLHALWPALKAELGDVLLDESREQYIRYALSVWREPPNIDGTCDPLRAVRALEVLCVLFDTIA